jgi:hypothetical protein
VRTASSLDLVQLPALEVGDGMALAAALVAAGKQRSLPGNIAAAHQRLEEAADGLAGIWSDGAADSLVARERVAQCDRALDAAWAGLYYLLVAWSKLPAERSLAAQATQVSDVLFPEGLRFTLLPFRVEWSESQRRLDRLRQDRLDELIAQLSGTVFLDAIWAAHRDYSEVLGMHAGQLSATDLEAARQPFQKLLTALRTYVLKVSAHADSDDPVAAGLAAALLTPLTDWSHRRL